MHSITCTIGLQIPYKNTAYTTGYTIRHHHTNAYESYEACKVAYTRTKPKVYLKTLATNKRVIKPHRKT